MCDKRAVRELYRSSSLQAIATRAAKAPRTTVGDVEFASYQCERIQDILPGLKIDFAVVSIIRTDGALVPIDFDCTTYNLDKSVVENYKNVADADYMSPAVYANPGRTITNAALFSNDEWEDTTFYRRHCRVYSIHRAMILGFLYPEHDLKFITFDYLASIENTSWLALEPTVLELLTLPFALAWLSRKDAMDEARLLKYFKAVENFTLTRLTYMRAFVNGAHHDLGAQAAGMGVSEGAYKVNLYETRDEIAGRFGLYEAGASKGAYKSLRSLDKYCGFLSMLGDASADLIIPSRMPTYHSANRRSRT